MTERIILAPGANPGELIKSLAMHGINCLAIYQLVVDIYKFPRYLFNVRYKSV